MKTIEVEYGKKKWKVNVMKSKRRLSFGDHIDKRSIIFVKNRGGLAIGIKVPVRQTHEYTDPHLNIYSLSRSQLAILKEWAK